MGQRLTLQFDYEQPIELTALSRALTRVGQRYAREARINGDKVALHINTIRQGSIIVDLAPIALVAAATVSSPAAINTTVEFTRNLKVLFDYFLRKGPRPPSLSARDCDDAKDIVQPIVDQSGGGIKIYAEQNATVHVSLSFNALEANAIQNSATREREALAEPSQKAFSGRVFYWQATDRDALATQGRTPDRGVIEDLDSAPHRVFFDDASVKQAMTKGHPIFETGFIVDGEMLVARGKTQGYKIFAVRDAFPLE
jgi:hypothetical protein